MIWVLTPQTAGAQRSPPLPAPTPTAPVEEVVQDDEVLKINTVLIQLWTGIYDEEGLPAGKARISSSCQLFEDGVPQTIDSIEIKTAAHPVAMAVAMDLSGSMSDHYPTLKTAFASLQGSLRVGDSALLTTYTSEIKSVRIDLHQPYARSASGPVIPAREQEAIDSIFEVDSAHVNEEDLPGAIARSIELLTKLPKDTRKTLVIFSDGGNDSPSQPLSDAVDKLEASGIEVVVLKFGDDDATAEFPASYAAFERISRMKNGYYAKFSDISELKSTLQMLAKDRTEDYVLSYYPLRDLTGVKSVNLMLECKGGVKSVIHGAVTSGQKGGAK